MHPWQEQGRATRASLAAVAAALCALCLAYVTRELTDAGGDAAAGFFSTWVSSALMVGATGMCVTRAVLVPVDRRAWAAIAIGLAGWTAGDALWNAIYARQGNVPTPSAADVAYLVQYVSLYVGLCLLLRARMRPTRASLWLDGLVVGLALGALAAAATLAPILASTAGNAAAAVVGLAYEGGDLAMLCLAVLAVGLTGWRPSQAWASLALGLITIAVADGWYAYLEAAGSFGPEGVVNALWPVAALLIAASAWQPWAQRRVEPSGVLIAAVPGVFALVAVGVLLVSARFAPEAFIAVGAVLAAIARGWLTLREHHALLRASQQTARTDALTGLRNRRALVEELDHVLQGPGATRWRLALCDLDGFKSYNDAFGHVAGDALLARLGRRLEATVGAAGTAFRPGGDEFCVLLREPAARDLVADVAHALSEHGDAFAVGASIGIVHLGREADDAEAALQLADARMYAAKERRRPSAQRQARDLLVRVLDEREPTLTDHLRGVAGLAADVARALGLTGEAVDEVTRAAELHDVGKVAIPDAVLHKAGPLDELEWRLMRQHTVVGERILLSVPAMRPVAGIVRSSHERWDGGGYPDGLAGDQIPIGARIVAVCDAFDAMISERTYQAAMTPDEALAELERCAGTQFDPEVLAAFRPALAARSSGVRPAGQRVGRTPE